MVGGRQGYIINKKISEFMDSEIAAWNDARIRGDITEKDFDLLKNSLNKCFNVYLGAVLDIEGKKN